MQQYNYILTPTKLTIVGNNKHIQIETTHERFNEIKQLLKEGKFEDIIKIVDVKEYIGKYINNELTIEGDNILYNNKPIHNTLVSRILQFRNEGFDFEPLMKFLKNQIQNPSEESVKDLYDFIEHGNMPITSDGCFLAYKYVDSDYFDNYTHTFDNHIGCVCEMNRKDVDSDRNVTCSSGLHVCTLDYLSNYNGSHVMIVKVNPKDVVSVPVDYDQAKMRCCRYEVVDEYTDFVKGKEFFDKSLYNEYDEVEEFTEFDFEVDQVYTMKNYLNNVCRKGVKVKILEVYNDSKGLLVSRLNGHIAVLVSMDKFEKNIEK